MQVIHPRDTVAYGGNHSWAQDARLAEASYRHQLLKGLPPMRRTRDSQSALSFLAEAVTTKGQETVTPDADADTDTDTDTDNLRYDA